MKFCKFAACLLFSSTLTFAQQSEKPVVLFSGPPKTESPVTPPTTPAGTITDAERLAVAITAWDLEVHLTPRDEALEMHARVTLHNNGAAPLKEIPLQLSSSLHFETIGFRGRRISFSTNILNSDADHTGQLVEAAIPLPEPLVPGAGLTLDVDYGGTIPQSAKRLLAIGAPDANAQASDWDRISAGFTGVRGFGNVVWYPVSSVPCLLGDGAKLFHEIGRQKLLDQNATVAIRVTDEFFDEPPNAAALSGHFIPLDKPTSMPTASFPGIITASLPSTRLGFDTPSLFLARRTEISDNGIRVLTTDADAPNAKDYILAAGSVAPLIKTWFGNNAHALATILDLPEPDDLPAETGDLLLTPLSSDPPQDLAPVVAHALAHASFVSPRAWLNEGVASFIGTLWIDSTQGHTAAIENLNAGRTALALAEPGSPGQGPGEDLLHAISPVYYRTKATYVLWMLRSLVGDKSLAAALQAYRPSEDTQPDYFRHILEQTSGRDLGWFFSNWVDEDRGLPDLSIAGVYPSPEAHQQVLVAVDIANDGYAEASVPVTLKGTDGQATHWVRVPAHGHITQRMLFQETPSEVDLNDGSVPEVQTTMHQKILSSSPAE
ncbi:MAG TPA: hypothetical protein VMD92_19440 [Acidobacteriaceae bacterium]|jgi:hypothetical protein|nr:hypothetical protein [Acidobacteriaceae bacterium]